MKTIFTIISVLFLFVSIANAQWTECGLYGGGVKQIVSNGSFLFVGTEYNGVFRSTNTGESWVKVNTGLLRKEITAMAVCGTTIYAGTTFGTYLSTNNGDNWEKVQVGYTYENITSISVKGKVIFICWGEGVYCSTDSGSTWSTVSTGLPAKSSVCIALTDSMVFAGTTDGIYKSTDYGNSWTQFSTNLHEKIVTLTIVDSMIFAGTSWSGLYKSTLNVERWSVVSNLFSERTWGIVSIDGSLLAWSKGGSGLYKSKNVGLSWSPLNNVFISKSFISMSVVGNTLFAVTQVGVYRSTDDGDSWVETQKGLAGSTIYSLAANDMKLFAATSQGVFSSTDNGNKWVFSGLADLYVASVITKGDTVFAGTYREGVYRSVNNGESWQKINLGLPYKYVQSIIILDSVLIAAPCGKGAICRSTDNGNNWIPTTFTIPIVNSFIAVDKTLYGTTGSSGIIKSTDYGLTWSFIGSEMNSQVPIYLTYSDSMLFVGTESKGVYNEDESGNWWQVNSGITDNRILSITSGHNIIYAGVKGGEVFKSIDNAKSWTTTGFNQPRISVTSLFIKGTTLFAGTLGAGIWKVENYLETNENLKDPISEISQLTCYPNPTTNMLTIDRTKLSNFTDNHPVTYSITTLTGVKRMQFEQQATQFTIPVNGFPSGVYYVTAEQGTSRAAVMVTVVE